MYTTVLGQRLLSLLNQQRQLAQLAEYSPLSFFEQVYWPLFFDDDQKTLFWVINSPFIALEVLEKKQHVAERRVAVRDTFLANLGQQDIHGSNAVGYPARNKADESSGWIIEYATTSAQAVRYSKPTMDQALASWYGASLGIGVDGGLCVGVEVDSLLIRLYEGWHWYRWYLTQYPQVKGRQLETWNGLWLCHCLSDRYNPDDPMEGFDVPQPGQTQLSRIHFSQLVDRLAVYLNRDSLTAYVYSLGNTNTTIGYIPIQLGLIRALIEQRQQFTFNQLPWDHHLAGIELEHGFYESAFSGIIGLDSYRPRALKGYISTADRAGKIPKPDLMLSPEMMSCQAWLMAYLNLIDPSLVNWVSTVASVCQQVSGQGKKNRGGVERVNQFLKATRPEIMPSLLALASESQQDWELICDLMQGLSGVVQSYVQALIRFKYVQSGNSH